MADDPNRARNIQPPGRRPQRRSRLGVEPTKPKTTSRRRELQPTDRSRKVSISASGAITDQPRPSGKTKKPIPPGGRPRKLGV